MSYQPAYAIRLETALAVRPFISKEETRYYLNGIHVEPVEGGGAIAVATCGHRLGAKRDAEGLSLLPVITKLPKQIKAERSHLDRWLVCMVRDASASKGYVAVVELPAGSTAQDAIDNVDECTMRFGDAVIDGTFPNWRRVIPQNMEAEVKGFNAELLKSFGRAIAIRGGGHADPHIVATEDRDFIGVIMPMRAISEAKLPDWLDLPAVRGKEMAA